MRTEVSKPQQLHLQPHPDPLQRRGRRMPHGLSPSPLERVGVRLFGGVRGLLAVGLLCSCEATGWQDTRRPLEDEGALRVSVQVRLNWEASGLGGDPEVASVWFFPEGGEPKVLSTNETLDSISLPPGDYRILAFNGLLENNASTREQRSSVSFANIGFRGTDRYETFEAFCLRPQQVSAAYSRPADEPAMSPPEALAAGRYDDGAGGDMFRITMEMVDRKERPELTFTPVPAVATLELTAHVGNLISAATIDGANTASVSGLGESVFLATGRTGEAAVTHYFTLNHRQYDDPENPKDGTLRGGCFTFGLPQENSNLLGLWFTLRDSKEGTPKTYFHRDLTEPWAEQHGKEVMQLDLRVEVGKLRLGENDTINLPDTQPPEEVGSNFDADVDEWGDDENVALDI